MRQFLASLAGAVILGALPGAAQARVEAAAADHFRIVHEVTVPLAPDRAWRRLVTVSAWWEGSHSYSGQARNLSLEARAGGCWCERWADGSVEHGRVLMAMPQRALRIEGAFGPLQAMAVQAVMDFALTAGEAPGTTRIRLTYVASGSSAAQLDAIAPAVDGVLGIQMARLAAP